MFTQPSHPHIFSYCLLLAIDHSIAKSFNTTTINRCIHQTNLKEAVKRERHKGVGYKNGLAYPKTPLFLLHGYKIL